MHLCINNQKGGKVLKTYETPEIKVCEFDVEDIIATSAGIDLTPGENETDIIFPQTVNLMS